jgi:hypothetical protein
MGSGAHPDPISNSAVIRKLLLKSRDFFSQDEAPLLVDLFGR